MATTLQSTLDRLRTRVHRASAVRAALWAIAATLIALITAAWIDLVVELPDSVRLTCVIGGAVVLLIVGAVVLLSGLRDSQPGVIASRLDDAASQRGQIVAGVNLLLHPSYASGTMTAGLASIAIDRAAQLAGEVPAQAIARPEATRRPIYLLGALVALLLVVMGVSPRLLRTQWLRFADPFGDHPPFSRLQFSVTPGHTSVIYGANADVQVKVDGAQTDRVDLVLRSENGAEEAIPMFPIGADEWRASVANVTTPVQYFTRVGRARSVRYQMSVITVPQIQDVSFTVTFPAYANKPAYTGPLPAGGLAGLPGTHVQATARSNRDLKSGALRFTPSAGANAQPATIAMAPAGTAQSVSGGFEITAPGRIELSVIDVDGQASRDTFAAPVTVLRDDKPFIRLIEPKAASFATPDAVVQINALAEDDYGVGKVSLYRGLNDSRPRPMEIPVPTPAPTRFLAQSSLRISDYGLKPGDVVQLFARVEDNDPAGAKGSESGIVRIHIVSQQEMDQMILAREGLEALEAKYAAVSRQMEAVADKMQKAADDLAKLPPDSALADEKRKELAALAQEAEKASEEIAKLADKPLPVDLDKALNESLKDARAALKQAADAAQGASAPGQSASEAHKKMLSATQALGKGREQLKQNVTDPLEHLAAIYPLLEDQARFLQLAAAQKDLAFRLQSMETQKGEDNPQLKARMRELQDEQEQLRESTRKLADDIRDHAAKLPEDPKLQQLRETASDFVAKLDASGAIDHMQKAEQALQDFAGTRASISAEDAARALDSLIAKCRGMGKEGEQCLAFQPKLAEGLGDTLEQLLGASGLGKTGPMGMGQGGYSAQRSTLKNVGLYGARPRAGKETSTTGDGRADRGAASNPNGDLDPNTNPDGTSRARGSSATGQGDAPVPPQYKHRVSDYFRSVADELEQ